MKNIHIMYIEVHTLIYKIKIHNLLYQVLIVYKKESNKYYPKNEWTFYDFILYFY
jgi:hypothetical protein